MKKTKKLNDLTKIAHSGKGGTRHHGTVSTPIYHTSTIIFENVEELFNSTKKNSSPLVTYGRKGTPTTFSIQDAIADLENAESCIAVPSGLCAVTTTLLSLLASGDHLLMVDTVYSPVRDFCDKTLYKLGIETTYYMPSENIEALLRPNTKVIFLESPGSLTFEIQDIPYITEIAQKNDIYTIIDNTWATPFYFKPLVYGVDVSIQSATKYICGHADVMMGTISSNGHRFNKINKTSQMLGLCASPNDCFLALRGLRTLGPRLETHSKNAFSIATWLTQRSGVKRVLYPPLENDPGHKIWKRDYTGGSGLFGVIFQKINDQNDFYNMINNLNYFSIGYSWGGFESLILPVMHPPRTASPWTEDGYLVRIHAGLENVDDLLHDLDKGLSKIYNT